MISSYVMCPLSDEENTMVASEDFSLSPLASEWSTMTRPPCPSCFPYESIAKLRPKKVRAFKLEFSRGLHHSMDA